MTILGYGEDFLTLELVSNQLAEIIDDNTNPDDATVFYRPSFGRGSNTAKKSSQFGEFDAIIVTPKTAYLIESKWDGTTRDPSKSKCLELSDNQVLRHRILEWYNRNWRPEHWDTDKTELINKFEESFPNKTIAPKGSRLRENLTTLLNYTKPEMEINHIVAFFSKTTFPPMKLDYGEIKFKKMEISYSSTKGNFISL